MNKEENELEKWGRDLTKISVPSNLDAYIKAGIERGRRSHRSRFRKVWLRSTITAAAVIILLTFSVRLSPAFARTVSDFPVLSYLVNLINGDPSVQEAVKNNYIKKLDLSETHNHVTITLDSMVADRHRMVIFYKVESVGGDTPHEKDQLLNPRLYDENGKELPVGIIYDFPSSNKKSEPALQQIDIDLLDCKDKQLTNPLILKMKQQGQTWTFKLPYEIQKVKMLKAVYPIHQTVSMEGQKITFNSVTVYPTGSAIDVSYDPTNSKQITHLDDLRLVDDQGKVFAVVKNGISSSGTAENNHQVLFLDSNYFTKPKSLHLELTRARAIDKTEQDVVVSLKNQKLLKAPSDHLLTLKMIRDQRQSPKDRMVNFLIKLPKMDFHQGYQLFDSKFQDGTGKIYSIGSWMASTPENSNPFSDIQFGIPSKASYKDPLTFHLVDYPTRIYGKVNLLLK